MTMALAGWPIERAMAAVPLSRIADQRAITPERLSDNADGRHAPASELGLTRIFRPPLTRSAPHSPGFAVGPDPRATYLRAHAKRQAQLRLLQLFRAACSISPVAYRSDGNA